jgi:hypothetical protein
MGEDIYGNPIVYQNNIDKYVVIAAPIYGSFLSNWILDGKPRPADCSNSLIPDSNEPALQDLQIISNYSYELNKRMLNKNVDYISIVGHEDYAFCLWFPHETSDGLVPAASGSLLQFNEPLVLLPKTHQNLNGGTWNGGDDEIEDLTAIINSFLKNESSSVIKSHFKKYSVSKYVHYGDPNSDSVGYGGFVAFNFVDTNPNNVKLKNNNYEFTLYKNQRTGYYFYYELSSEATFYYQRVTIPWGIYNLYVNDIDTLIDIEVKSLESKIYDIDLISNTTIDGCFNIAVGVDNDIVKPGESFTVEVDVENSVTQSIESIEVRVVVKGIDDGDDLEDDGELDDLDPGDDDSIEFDFEVPYAVKEKEYDIEVIVKGELENGTQCETIVNSTIEVEKEKHEMIMKQPNAIIYPTQNKVNITLWNIGQTDENVDLEVYNTELRINQTQNFELESGDDIEDIKSTKSFILDLSKATAKQYTFFAKATYNSGNEYESESFVVTVESPGCVPSWNLNSTWSQCDITDHQYKNYYDSNNCLGDSIVAPNKINQTCNYCSPNPINTSWSGWINISCLPSDLMNQSRNRKEYDSNYNTCYLVTGLVSDLWNSGNNKTHYEFKATESCNFDGNDDSDNDVTPDSQDSCPTTYGTYCHGCPQPSCGTCTYAYCPASGAPYCANSPISISCGNLECDNLDSSCTDYHDKTFYCNGQGSCQTSSVCDSFTYRPTSTICGDVVDCDYLDTICRDYHDQNRYCDGQGTCQTSTCTLYTNRPSSTQCGTKDCDYLDTECKDYNDVTKYCSQGVCGDPSCNSYTNQPSTTQCGTDYYEYSCPWGHDLGDDTGVRLIDSHCDGSGNCNAYNGVWLVDEECSTNQYCVGSGTTQNDNDFYCGIIACTTNQDCGTDGLINQRFCSGDEVWDYNRTYTCNNGSTLSASCSHSDTAKKIEDCEIMCQSGSCVSPLIIEDITVEVDGKDSSNLKDGDTIKRKAKPGSDIDVNVEINNGYQNSINLEDIEVEVILKDIDDGDDLDDEDEIDDIKPGDSDDLDFSFEVPKAVKKKNYNVLINIKSKDGNNNKFEEQVKLILKIDKEKHDVQIEKSELSQNNLECKASSILSINVFNMGSSDEDEVRLLVSNNDLGISFQESFDLEEAPDDKDSRRFDFTIINDNLQKGNYPISIKVYADEELMDEETLYLNIKECKKNCTDFDGKEGYYNFSYVQTEEKTYQDYCYNTSVLAENYCENNERKILYVACYYGCSQGKCNYYAVQQQVQTPTMNNNPAPTYTQSVQYTPSSKKTCFAFWCW